VLFFKEKHKEIFSKKSTKRFSQRKAQRDFLKEKHKEKEGKVLIKWTSYFIRTNFLAE
jgi:hypothetical protein